MASEEQSTGDELSKNLKTNLSNELRGSRIGPGPQDDNSSLEYAYGASCFENAAILGGIIKENGEAILDVNKSEPDNVEEMSIQQQVAGVNIQAWNSSSSFSSLSGCNIQHEGSVVNVSPIDQIGRGGKIITCPIDQIGRGGNNKMVGVQPDPLTPVKSGTPKRKFSPEGDSPYGRVRKMSTSVEASPLLRSQLVPYDENNQLLLNGAPDLISGIGRLQLRGDNNAQNKDGDNNAQNDGDSTAEVASTEPINIVQRLMRQAPRNRTASLGGECNERNRRSYKRRQRTTSLSSQRRIDMVFTSKEVHKMIPANNETSPRDVMPSMDKQTD